MAVSIAPEVSALTRGSARHTSARGPAFAAADHGHPASAGTGATTPTGNDSEPIVEAIGVVKRYPAGQSEVLALRSVDLRVEKGEMVAIVGPSGSGKTTLLNCLSGLDDIDGGQVRIAGRDMHAMSDRKRTDLRAHAMGFIFQAFNLVPVFTAAENVELPLLLKGASATEARRQALETLDLVGLGHRVDHRPAALSGGEQQRVAIARALAPQPAIVWTDEPTGNLDSKTAQQIMDVLHDLNRRGLTIVMVTHDASIADQAARVLTMQDGQIARDAPST